MDGATDKCPSVCQKVKGVHSNPSEGRRKRGPEKPCCSVHGQTRPSCNHQLCRRPGFLGSGPLHSHGPSHPHSHTQGPVPGMQFCWHHPEILPNLAGSQLHFARDPTSDVARPRLQELEAEFIVCPQCLMRRVLISICGMNDIPLPRSDGAHSCFYPTFDT